MSTILKDGAIMVTASQGSETALVTIRGKDHDFTPEQLRRFATALTDAAELLESRSEEE